MMTDKKDMKFVSKLAFITMLAGGVFCVTVPSFAQQQDVSVPDQPAAEVTVSAMPDQSTENAEESDEAAASPDGRMSDEQRAELLSQIPDVDLSNLGPDDYFDSDSLAPPLEGEVKADYELRVLDPEEDKSVRFVVVDKEYQADSTQARMTAAKRAMDLGRYDASIRLYKALLVETPEDPAVLIGYAAALQKAGRDDEAISSYEKVLKFQPDNMDAHINMLGMIGDRYPAVALQRLQDLEGKMTDFNPALIGQIAFTQARLGRYDEALQSYALIASREPESALHVLNMAIVADKAGMHKEAVDYYEEALQLDTVYSGGRLVDRGQVFDRLAQLR